MLMCVGAASAALSAVARCGAIISSIRLWSSVNGPDRYNVMTPTVEPSWTRGMEMAKRVVVGASLDRSRRASELITLSAFAPTQPVNR